MEEVWMDLPDMQKARNAPTVRSKGGHKAPLRLRADPASFKFLVLYMLFLSMDPLLLGWLPVVGLRPSRAEAFDKDTFCLFCSGASLHRVICNLHT